MQEKKDINQRPRIEYIDALKGFAIYLVVWGHALQFLRNGHDFWHNLPMFEFIYSFHMPLFFMLSGFFFRSSLRMDWREFFTKKSIQLVLPIVVWSLIFVSLELGFDLISGRNIYSLADVPKKLLAEGLNIWFLKELFITFGIVFVAFKVFKKAWLACVVSLLFVFVSPLGCAIQRVFLPAFWLGLFIKDYYSVFSKYAKQILVVSGIMFVISLFFWDGTYTMYVTKFQNPIDFRKLSFNLTNIDIAMFRMFIGMCGSLFFLSLFSITYSTNVLFEQLSKIGRHTLSIYVLQILLLMKLANWLIDFSDVNIWIYSLFITPAVALVILLMCLVIIKILSRYKFAKLLLFGNT